MECVLIANEKGGCCKTTSVILLTHCLTALGYRVLAIDLDTTGNLTKAFLPNPPKKVLYDVLCGDAELYDTIVHTKYGDILPTMRDITDDASKKQNDSKFPVFIPKNRKSLTAFFKELEGEKDWQKYLGSMIFSTGLEEHYDFVILDSCPSDGPIITSCFVAADSVLMPCEPNSLSIDGMKMTITAAIDTGTNAILDGLVFSKYDEGRSTRRETIASIKETAAKQGMPLYDCKVRDSAAIETSMNRSSSVLHPDFINSGNGSTDALNFALEFLRRRDLEPKLHFPGVFRDETGKFIHRKNNDKLFVISGDAGELTVETVKFKQSMIDDPAFVNAIGSRYFFDKENADKHCQMVSGLREMPVE